MYKCNYPPSLIEKLRVAQLKSPSVLERLSELENNPKGRAIETCVPAFGQYYVNANRYDIVFDIDEDKKLIEIRDCILHTTLYRILKAKIQPNQ